MSLTIASWNINSVRIRIPAIKRLSEEHSPDILCLQETKTEDSTFPADALKELGYEYIFFAGEKSYNGVAILSRIPLHNIKTKKWAGVDDRRHIAATLADGTEIHNFYVPAGGDIADPDANPKFAHKLRFLDEMTIWAQEPGRKQSIILGDFNIAPLEHDVWSHRQLLRVVSHTPLETEKLKKLQETQGWIDSHRQFVDENEKLYSWWSYRARDWGKSDRGRRLDHIWLTPDLRRSLKNAYIVRDMRGWESPSDHVAVIAEIKSNR